MKTYKSYIELKGNTLELGDTLNFKVKGIVYEYETMRSCLICLVYFDIIFQKLNIKNIYEFCLKSYGYKTNNGIFPVCRKNDFEALTRLALDLFKLCDNYKGDKK